MSRRWSLALGLSVLAHLALIALGLGLGARRFTGPVDIEITGMRLDEVKDLPLGSVAGGRGAGHAAHRAHHRAPPPAPAEGALAAKADDRERAGQKSSADDEDAAAPTNDLSAYGPKGSRLTVLLRLDRLRGTDYAPLVDGLLSRLPDRRDLLEGTDLDLFETFDALLIATPHPLDPSVTFLAARHHLDDAGMRAALSRGARATGRQIAWRTQGGRPVGERRPRGEPPPGPRPSRDDRLIVLASPGLAIVTPPAYRALLLAPHAPASASDGGAAPEAGSPASGASPDGGAPEIDWATMLRRIDAEEGLIPSDGVLMVSAVDIFKTANGEGGVPPVMYGMEVPASVSAVVSVGDDSATLDLEGEFSTEDPARHWETEWPTIEGKLARNTVVIVTGFSSLVSRATLTRDGRTVRVHLAATHDEALRLLGVALHLLGG